MTDAVAYAGAAIALILIFFAFSLFMRFWNGRQNLERADSQLRTQKDEQGKTVFVRCPLCNTPLAKHENLSSVVYQPMNVPDQRMTVKGCPHCYPVLEAGLRRTCPVCGRDVAQNGYLIARLFNKPGKKHVIVAGCAKCVHHK